MTRILMASLVAAVVMAVGAPRPTAGEIPVEPAKSANACSCTARHQARAELRDYLKTKKPEQLVLKIDLPDRPRRPPWRR